MVATPWRLTMVIMASIATEISIICRPIGTPLEISDLSTVRLGAYSARSWRLIHSR